MMERRSGLLGPRGFAFRHPRVFASIWFAGCAGLAVTAWLGVVSLILLMLPDNEFTYTLLRQYGLIAVAIGFGSALLPGALLGSRLLIPDQVQTAKRALARSAAIVLLSHLCAAVIVVVLMLSFAPGTDPSMTLIDKVRAGLAIALVAILFGLVLFGIVTFPLGCTAGWLLWKRQHSLRAPAGCRLHGYREVEPG